MLSKCGDWRLEHAAVWRLQAQRACVFEPQSRWDSASPGLMNISAPFIRRPVGTVLLTAAIALAGIVAYLQLPVSPLPQVDFPTITVQAALPGASPEIMASSVAAPLERQLGHIAGVNEMTSASFLGTTAITLQ